MADQNAVQLNYDLVPSPQLQSKLQRQFADLERNLKFKSPFSATAREVKDFGSELDRANQRVITLGASFAVLTTSLRTLKAIVTATIEVEKAFTEINAVFQLGSQGLDRFSKDLFNAARTTGQSFERAAEAAKEFSRQGLTAQETIKRTTDALMLSRLANLDVAKSVETLTASINGFQKSALTSTEIVNKLATVDARFAVSSSDLAEGLARAGAAAADAGVNFDQLVGLITSAQQTTARGGAVIGNSLKTIFTRVERSDTIDAFRSLGVEVEDASGRVLGAIPLLTNFARTYDSLGGAIKKQAAEMVGGVYQINILKAVLGDLAKANGIAAQATDVSKTATNEAIKRNEALNQSLDSMLTKLGVTSKQIGANIGSQSFAGPLKSVMSVALDNPLTKALEDASGKAETAGGKFAEFFMKGIGGSLVFGLGPLIGKALGGVVAATGRNVMRDFSMLAGVSSESQKQAALQADINTLYRQGGAALQQQLAAMSSLTAQADALQRLLSVGSKGGTGQMASILYQRGVRSSRAPGAAGGYVPMAEEAVAISAGVGGAPMGARPVYLPSFNRGGGQRGIVANTSEWVVPGAAGGSIYNRDMISRFGLPPGAKPVAAGGYIPNAADGGSYGFGDLRLKAGTVGNIASGFQVQPTQIKALNDLFGNLAKAGSVAEASNFGPHIVDFANSLDKLSSKRVFRDLGREMDRVASMDRVKGSARAGGPDSIIESRAWSGNPYVIPQAGILNRNRDATYAPGAIAANEVLQQLGLTHVSTRTGVPTTSPAATPSRWQRMRGAINGQNAGYAAAFGLPFAGANIDEGVGGTGMGMLRGAAGAGLSMAGTGAAFGMMAGPGGALIGGGVGLLLGGAYGAISKMEESFEELARRIQEANAKINGEVNATTEIFQLQEQLKTAKENRLPESKIDDIKQNINRAFSKVSNPEVLRLLRTQMDDPEVQSKVGDEFSKSKRTAIGGLDLAAAVQGALQEGSSTRGLYGYNSGARDRISGAVQPFIANLSPEEQKKLRAMAQNDPSAALRQIGGLAGLGDDQQAKMVDRGSSGFLSGRLGGVMAEQTLILFENSILDALDNLRRKGAKGFADSVEAAIAKTERFTKTLEDLSSEYQVQSRFVQIEADALQQIGKARQSIGMNDPTVSDRDRIDLQGRFDRQNISAQFSAQRSGSLLSAQAGLFDMINKKGFESPQLRERLQGLTSVEDVNRLKGDINRPGGIPMLDAKGLIKALDDLAENLTVLNTSEKSRMEVSRMTIGLLQRQFDQTRSFSGAVGDDTGLYNRARAAREEAIARGESSEVIADASGDERLAQTRLLRRFMMRSDEDVDVESMGIDLRRQADAAKRARAAKIGLGRETLVGLGVEDGAGSFSDDLNQSGIDLEVAKRLGSDSETIRRLRIKNAALKRQDRYRNSDGTTEGAARLGALEDAERFTSGDPFANGQDITGARMATARERGLQGDSKGSFLGGFRAEIEGAKRDLLDFSEVGSRVAQNLHGSGVDAWSSWVTGAKQGKDAFRDFSISVLSDAQRMLASKAFSAALGAIPGFGVATGGLITNGGVSRANGGPIGFAAGGMVPAMLTGGEVYISPRGVQRIGADKLRGINSGRQGYAAGGDVRVVRGGSGVKDDVPANLPPGSFIVKKSVAQRLGPRYFESLAAGRVQHRFLGGFLGMPALYGALLGGGIGYATGGKKGAIGGALLGGIAGGLYGMNSGQAPTGWRDVGGAQATKATLSIGEKALLMGGASAGLGLLANGMTKRDKEAPGPISLAQVPAYRAQLEADQQKLLNGRGAGQSAYLSINPQGGYSLAGVGADVATRRWFDTGGGVDLPLSSGGGMSSEPKVTVAITINNNGQTSATASSSNGEGPFGGDFAGKLEKAIRPIVRDELVQQSRSDGFFSQRSRYVNNS